MKLTSTTAAATSIFLFGSFSHSLLVVAKPIGGNGQCSLALEGQNKANSFGAVYFINNEPKGNFIVSHDIQSDGTVQFARATYAGGRGLHGDNSPDVTGPDALFSQGSIKVGGKNLFVVNPGSDTIAMFTIDPSMPSNITMIGDPVSSGGNFPVSIAVSPKTGNVCVVNGGQTNGVQCFKQDSTNGLVEINNTRRSLNLKQTTPPNGPANTVSHVLFSEDGSQLIASVKGLPPNTKGFLATWDVNSKDGSLSTNFVKSEPGNGGLLPFSMTVIKGKNAILNTDAAAGFSVFDFSNKQTLSAGKVTSAVTKIDGQKATCWSAFSSKTGTFFLSDIGTSKVTEVNVDDKLNAKIVKQYSQQEGSAIIDLDIGNVRGADFAYVLAPNATSISVLQLGNGAGQAKNLQQFNFAKAAKKAGVKVNANNMQGMTVFVKTF